MKLRQQTAINVQYGCLVGPVGWSSGRRLPALSSSENSSPSCYTPRGRFIVPAAVMVLVCLCTSNACAVFRACTRCTVAGGSEAVLSVLFL